MSKTLAPVALLALAAAAHAQAPACSCDAGATRTSSNADLVLLLSNRMVCANVGAERWQEWHNGSSSGPVVDYKLGPGVQPDPSTTVGTYAVANNLVTYTYDGGGGSYTYDVCLAGGGTSHTFCGAAYGGRNIANVKIGGAGLQPCDSIATTTTTRTTSATTTRTTAGRPRPSR